MGMTPGPRPPAPGAPPPDPPPVDVRGYQLPPAALGSLTDDATTVRIRQAVAASIAVGGEPVTYKCPLHGTVWARPGVPPCDCDPYLDADP